MQPMNEKCGKSGTCLPHCFVNTYICMYLFTYISIYFYYCKIKLHTLLADFFFQVHQFDSYTHLDANTHTEKDTHTYTGTIASCILTSILQCHLTFVTATGTKRCRLQCSAVRVMASGKRNAGGEIEGSRKSGRRKRGWAWARAGVGDGVRTSVAGQTE